MRAVIDAFLPAVDGGRFPSKCIAGEAVTVEAHCFTDGHDRLHVVLRWVAAGGSGGATGSADGDSASTAKVVRVVDGETIVTDGPFAETKEQLGGVFVTDLPDLDEAIRIAALIPAASYGTLEIRPLIIR